MEYQLRWTQNIRTLYHLTCFRYPWVRSAREFVKRIRTSSGDPCFSVIGITLNRPSTHNGDPTTSPGGTPLFAWRIDISKWSAADRRHGGLRFLLGAQRHFSRFARIGIRPGQKILVPAYLCTAAIEPIEYFGAEMSFYTIRRNCSPDWSDLESKIRGNVRAILAVHYFGFPCEIERFCALRDQYNLFLIEDCAHVLDGVPSEHRLGELGDFSVFSPRKYLPVFDGGTLRLNRPAPGFQIRWQFESPLFTL